MINRRTGYGILTAQFINKLTRQMWRNDGRDIIVTGKEYVVQYAELSLLLIFPMKEHQLFSGQGLV